MAKYPLENNFTYHKPFGNQAERYQQLRDGAKALAQQIILQTPESREQSLALTNLEQAVFWANAAIARNENEEATSFGNDDVNELKAGNVTNADQAVS